MSHLTITQRIAEVTSYLTEGRVVAFPTGTSYGLATDALQGWALQRLSNLKQRPVDKTFTVFMNSDLWSQHLRLTAEEEELLSKWSEQPVTLLVTPAPSLEHLGQDGLVGLRIIDHPVMAELAKAVDVPLTATSANVAGQAACFDVDCIKQSFPQMVDDNFTYNLSLAAIIDAGTLPKRKPSAIVQLTESGLKEIRAGAVDLSSLQQFQV